MKRIIVSSNVRSWLVWFLPFLVSCGMAFGSLLGFGPSLGEIPTDGQADIMGAAGALLGLICILMGFVMATLTIIVAKVLRRDAPSRITLRFGLSIMGGSIIGVLSDYPGVATTVVAWLLLICLPVLLAWSWHAKADSSAATPIE
jgi:hypothetical protein